MVLASSLSLPSNGIISGGALDDSLGALVTKAWNAATAEASKAKAAEVANTEAAEPDGTPVSSSSMGSLVPMAKKQKVAKGRQHPLQHPRREEL